MSNYEEMLSSFRLNKTCPIDCGAGYVVKGEDLFPFRYIDSSGNPSTIRIGYRCPSCGEVVECAVPADIAIYLVKNRNILKI